MAHGFEAHPSRLTALPQLCYLLLHLPSALTLALALHCAQLYGHQIVAHLVKGYNAANSLNAVDGDAVSSHRKLLPCCEQSLCRPLHLF